MSYFPWGEERGQGTADNRTKFAGYYRDMPGQDYAMARYYSATSGELLEPGSGWDNRLYAKPRVAWDDRFE